MRNDTADNTLLLGSNTGKVLLVARWHVRVPILGRGRGDDALNVAGRVVLDLRKHGGRDGRGEGIDCGAPFGLCGHAGVIIGNGFDDVGCLGGQLVDGGYKEEGGGGITSRPVREMVVGATMPSVVVVWAVVRRARVQAMKARVNSMVAVVLRTW